MVDCEGVSIVDLAGIVAEHLQSHGIRVVLVGGLAVEIYSENLYLTKDIDMVNVSHDPVARIIQAMDEIGFKKHGRFYINDTTPICVEFPPAPLAVGDELIQKTTIVKCGDSKIPILLAVDVVKDRLTAYFHWNDKPSLVQALAVMVKHSIRPAELTAFCGKEGQADAAQTIERLYQMAKEQNVESMEELQSIVLLDFMNQI